MMLLDDSGDDVYQFKGCTVHRFCNVYSSYFHQRITILLPDSSNIRRKDNFKECIIWKNHGGQLGGSVGF